MVGKQVEPIYELVLTITEQESRKLNNVPTLPEERMLDMERESCCFSLLFSSCLSQMN